jgi:hypothetical protein
VAVLSPAGSSSYLQPHPPTVPRQIPVKQEREKPSRRPQPTLTNPIVEGLFLFRALGTFWVGLRPGLFLFLLFLLAAFLTLWLFTTGGFFSGGFCLNEGANHELRIVDSQQCGPRLAMKERKLFDLPFRGQEIPLQRGLCCEFYFFSFSFWFLSFFW